MKGLILVNAYFSDESYLYQAKRLKAEFEKKSVAVDIRRIDDFSIYIENGKLVSDYPNVDFIIYWDKDKYTLNMLDKLGVRLFNTSQAIMDCDDKMTTYIALSDHNIPIPKTLSGLLCFDPKEEIKLSTVKAIEDKLKYPIIAKYSYGSLGKGVFMAHNREELIDIMNKLKCSPHLYQECITSSYGKDLRIIVVGGEVVGGMIRESSGDFRSNIGAGGHGTVYTLTEEQKELAEKIASILNLDYCGIDILFGENGPVVCEVNSNAFFCTFEKITSINVAEKYVNHVIKTINNR